MKKILTLIFMVVFNIFATFAATKADTLAINYHLIQKAIVDETINTKGAKVKKYYFLYNGELISTSKNVIEKYNLCRKYNARLAMVMVKRGNNKRIILN